jgi:hypothetical protein
VQITDRGEAKAYSKMAMNLFSSGSAAASFLGSLAVVFG